jgi:predicted nucleic acid-binding protein
VRHVLFDTDVILDFLFDRKPFSQNSLALFLKCEDKELCGYVTPVILSNIYYITMQESHHAFVLEKLKVLVSIFTVLPMDQKTVHLALHSKFNDFEDALQYAAALGSKKIDALVTRNLKDFKKSTIPVFSPGELLSVLQQEA